MELVEIITHVPGAGFGIVFLWLYLRERSDHNKTLAEYRDDLRAKIIQQRKNGNSIQ